MWYAEFEKFGRVLLVPIMALFAGCASTPDDYRDPRDPLEPYNRAMHRFNTDLDNAFLKPIATGYKKIVPDPVDKGVTNVFNNLADIPSAVNNLLQFKLSRAGNDVGRVLINTTVGILGVIDVASNMGLPSYKEDFGQTLGSWGAEAGPYIVLPLLGPSSLRDTVALPVDIALDPLFNLERNRIYWGVIAVRLIDKRADLLTATKVLEEAALDPYVFIRDAYLQRRRNQVYDGNPPPDDYEEEWEADDEERYEPALTPAED